MTDENPAPTAVELRWFGALLFAASLILAVVLAWRFDAWRGATIAVGVGASVALVYYSAPPLRIPLFLGWRTATAPLGRVVSRLLLAAIYFGLITPASLVMRLLGRDPLELRSSRESYWSERETRVDPARYFRQS